MGTKKENLNHSGGLLAVLMVCSVSSHASFFFVSLTQNHQYFESVVALVDKHVT